MDKELNELAYPVEFRWLIAHGFKGLTPWHFIDAKRAESLRCEFQKETGSPNHKIQDILPFASRQDRDDIAGFLIKNGVVTTCVIEVHLTWKGSPETIGYPTIDLYDSIWVWLKTVLDETALWCSEQEFLDLS